MKTILLTLCLFFVAMQMQGQKKSKQVFGSSGESITNGTYTLNFTVGEPIIGMVQNGVSIHQGFWGELYRDTVLSVSRPNEVVDQIKLYPNPVVNYLNIHFKKNESINYQMNLVDINGRKVFQTILNSQNSMNQLDIGRLSQGIYLLTISSKENNYNNSFKIIKK